MLSPTSKAPSSATRLRSKTWAACSLTCVALLQGCAATSPASLIESQPLPSPPSLSTPAPAQPYSKSWQIEVDEWLSAVQSSRARLMATPLMRD